MCPIMVRMKLAASLVILLGWMVAAPSAQAGVILTILATSAPQGSTGNSLQVILTNDDPAGSIQVSGFNFLIESLSPDITFEGADFATTLTYIFAGNSFDQNNLFPLDSGGGGQSLAANDSTDAPGSFTLLGPGESVGLANVLFDVAAGAMTGFAGIVFDTDPANTSISDLNGLSIPIDQFVNGSVLVTASANTPEPPAAWLVLAGLPLLGWRRLRASTRN